MSKKVVGVRVISEIQTLAYNMYLYVISQYTGIYDIYIYIRF